MFICKTPQSLEEFEQYYQLRWQILRAPWQQPQGSEQDELEEQACHRMLVDENNRIIAVGRFHKTAQHEGQIRYMAVAQHKQGIGAGQQLLACLENIAQQQGVTLIHLNAREQAVAFYQQQGYQKQHFSHQLFDDINHYQMTKTLAVNTKHQQQVSNNLQIIWHNTIPISKAMNIEISFYDQQQLICHCEPSFNKNLHNTMFAGSIYTLATLTGWGWAYLKTQEQQFASDIVLAKGEIKYLAPITGVAHAYTNTQLIEQSDNNNNNRSKLRFTIKVNIHNGDKIAAVFKGNYVAIAKNKKQ